MSGAGHLRKHIEQPERGHHGDADTDLRATQRRPHRGRAEAVNHGSRPADRTKEQGQGPGGSQLNRTDFTALKSRLQRQFIAELAPEADLSGSQAVGRSRRCSTTRWPRGIPLPRMERTRLLEAIIAEVLSFGPIEPLLRDQTISEIMVNGPNQVWVERNGQLEETDVRFEDDEHVRRIIDRIIAPLGRRCDEASPMVDARLPDGSRVNAIIPPLSLVGPVITIRKFSRDLLTMQNLVQLGSITPEVGDFLAALRPGLLNILVSGGTGSGKTTLLNILSSYIPSSERIVTIEDAAELQLRQEHVITLEKRPANIEGRAR